MLGGREQEAIAEVNRAHQLDPLSPIISFEVGNVHNLARQYDEAIAVCQKSANENPTFAMVHQCLANAYWGKRMYPQLIEEWKTYGRLSGDRNESDFSSATEQGFLWGAGRVLSSKALKFDKRNAKLAIHLPPISLSPMPIWETKIRPSGGSTLLIRTAIGSAAFEDLLLV
jgi:tetratricopeptide (TPR) repeat protein